MVQQHPSCPGNVMTEFNLYHLKIAKEQKKHQNGTDPSRYTSRGKKSEQPSEEHVHMSTVQS
jgi:hypothetical protein